MRLRDSLRKFSRNRAGVVCLLALLFFFLLGVFGPILYRVDPLSPSGRPFLLPSLSTPMGTDNLGRDNFALFLNGVRVSYEIGFLAVGATLAIGIIVGSVARYFGGRV